MPTNIPGQNVYEAAMGGTISFIKISITFISSVSGEKTSSIMLQLAAGAARRTGKNLSPLHRSEAQYQATIDHVDELIRCTADVVDAWYWVAMPLSLRNAASAIRPKWICWDKKQKGKMGAPLPDREDVIMITEDSYPKEWTWFRRGMEFEEFILFSPNGSAPPAKALQPPASASAPTKA